MAYIIKLVSDMGTTYAANGDGDLEPSSTADESAAQRFETREAAQADIAESNSLWQERAEIIEVIR